MKRNALEHANVGVHGVVVEPALDHLAKPLPLSRRRFMHALSQAFLDLLQLSPACGRLGSCASRGSRPLRDLPQMKMKPRNLKVFRLAQAASFAVGRCETAELDQTGLVRMERQRKRRQSFTHRIQGEAVRASVSDSKPKIVVVGVAYDDHVALGFARRRQRSAHRSRT